MRATFCACNILCVLFLFTKVLRGAKDAPAYLSIMFAIEQYSICKSRLGRPITNLLDVIKKDLALRDFKFGLNTIDDLYELEFLAYNRSEWKKYERI